MRLDIGRRWWRGSAIPTPVLSGDTSDVTTVPLSDPVEMLDAHHQRLAALRLESGYSDVDFQTYILAPLLQCARYVHRLPASRAENHREMGGLFRFAFESACLAFRRADGRLFSGPLRAGASCRANDIAWRYSAFIAGLCSPMGRAHGVATVRSSDGNHTWSPHATSLCRWAEERQLNGYTIEWRRRQDARSIYADSLWIAARLLGADVVRRLQAEDNTITEALVDVVSGRGESTLSEIIAESTQAVVDQDLAVSRAANDLPTTGIRVEHRLLDAMRGLVRDKWTTNSAGSRVWVTDQGVFLNWRPAVNDILVRLRSDGVTGLPTDPNTLAELLVENSVLATNPRPASATAHRHHFRLVIQAPQVPRHPMDCVQIVSANLLGLQLDTVTPLAVEIRGGSNDNNGGAATRQAELDLAQSNSGGDEAGSELPVQEAVEASDPNSKENAQGGTVSAPEPAERHVPSSLLRYGVAGEVLAALLKQGRDVFIPVDNGVALAYPAAVKTVCQRPKDFLSSCQSQSLVIPEGGDAARLVRKRGKTDDRLPEQYIVLVPRLARSLGLTDESR